ncbi:MAG: hypothetical protein QXN05_00660 [Acidilobaceae archaeon]
MACFVSPLITGLLLVLVARRSEKTRRLHDLAIMMVGGSLLLATKHVLVGEPLIPFSLSQIALDVLAIGIPMVFATTAVWIGLTLANRRLTFGERLKKASGSPIAKTIVLSLLGLIVMLIVDFIVGHTIF